MPALILYLLKVNIALILFYLAYRFALRRLTFYTLNRFFLVCGIIFSSLYPLVNFSDLLKKHEEINSRLIVVVPDWNHVQHTVAASVPPFNYWQLLISLFWTGVIIMTIRLAIKLTSLYRVHRNSSPELFNNYIFRRISGEVNPFSFWQNIYLNPDQHKQEDLASILQHEQVHIKEWHTLDVLLAEINIVFYWFNPGVWLMKQAVKENLEFITDRRVLHSGIDSKTYQYSLLNISCIPHSHSLANNFNLPDIKKRIMMMNKKRSSNKQISRYLLLLPMIIILSLVFTVSKAQLEKKNLKRFGKSYFAKEVVSSIKNFPATIVKASNEIYEKAERNTSNSDVIKLTNGGSFNSYNTIDTPKVKPVQIKPVSSLSGALFVIDGIPSTAAEPLATIKADDIVSIKVLSNNPIPQQYEQYAEKAKNGIINIVTKKANLFEVIGYGNTYDRNRYNDGTLKPLGKPVNVSSVMIRGTDTGLSPVYVIDGVPVNPNDPNNPISGINPADVESINIFKGGAAMALYGRQAADGAILITTKSFTPMPREFSPNNDGINDKLVIDGIDKFGSVTLKVFNKFGIKIFEQSSYQNDWTGKASNGTEIPTGTYYYDLSVESDGRKFVGSIKIIK